VGIPFDLTAETVNAVLAALGPLAFFFAPTATIEALLDEGQAAASGSVGATSDQQSIGEAGPASQPARDALAA
jgi:hypothetical protein